MNKTENFDSIDAKKNITVKGGRTHKVENKYVQTLANGLALSH